jgi:hypothetical protein
MRFQNERLAAAVAVAVVLCACASTPGAGPPAPRAASASIASGIDPQALARMAVPNILLPPSPSAKHPRFLAVSDLSTSTVEILDRKYQVVSTITDGLTGADGDWYDRKGNLYVANYVGPNVLEYANGSTAPTFTYASGLTDPVDVTTDAAGNVYVADFGFGDASFVAEYPQGRDQPLVTCSTSLSNDGIALDASGNVFVAGNTPSRQGELLEYRGGLRGCSARELGANPGFSGGLRVDGSGTLAVCDQRGGIEIIPPPYTAVASLIPSFCYRDALSKADDLIYITQVSRFNILVARYPSGKTVTTLAGNGLSDPAAVATFPFAPK